VPVDQQGQHDHDDGNLDAHERVRLGMVVVGLSNWRGTYSSVEVLPIG
jgi:hypothetical protein